jgi:hypothetical protein
MCFFHRFIAQKPWVAIKIEYKLNFFRLPNFNDENSKVAITGHQQHLLSIKILPFYLKNQPSLVQESSGFFRNDQFKIFLFA